MAIDINHEINRLLHFAEQHELINHEDRYYAANCLLDVLQAEEYVPEEDLEEDLPTAQPILQNMLV